MNLSADLRLPPPTIGNPTSAELIAFAKYCADHIGRDLRGVASWELFVIGGLDGATDAIVRARVGTDVIEAKASAADPGSAIWEVMCDLEQPLRDAVARRRTAA